MRRRSGYTPRDWREVVGDPEPCSIDAETVAEFLESKQRPQMADFVRHVGRVVRERNVRETELVEAYKRICERLEQYEPTPAPFVPPSCVPPPEASD